MPSQTTHGSLKADRLMEHMRAICKGLPRRQSACEGERKAAEYVVSALSKMGLEGAKVEGFKGIPTLGLPAILTAAASLAALVLGLFAGAIGKIIGGALLYLAAYTFYQLLSCRPPLFRKLIERWDSRNVVATVPAAKAAVKRIFLVGHLDANKQRFVFPPPVPAVMKAMETAVVLLAALDGFSFLLSAIFHFNLSWLWIASMVVFAAFIASLAIDETQPVIEGANDNATAMAVLLGIGEALKSSPLKNAEVTLLFSGCEEVGNHGVISFLDAHEPPKEGSYWIDIEMVGSGGIAYATKHGISYLTEYAPAPEILRHAIKTAENNSELGVIGKDMLILEEVSPLRIRGHNALCVLGYDESGYLPHWHRVTDTLENIEPETLSRAARYVWALMQSIDSED